MKPKLVIYGASGHAMVVADIIRLRDEYQIVGFLDDINVELHGTELFGAPVLGGREQMDILQQIDVKHLILAFGDCDARLRLADSVLSRGFSLATVIHPQSSVAAGVSVLPGTVVKSMAVIEPGAKIKQNVIIGACAYIGHECIIEEGAHISGGGNIGGKSIIGRGAWIGLGATVKDRVRIGARAQIGAGSVVLEDVPDGVVAIGAPARPLWGRGLWNTPQEKRKVTPNED